MVVLVTGQAYFQFTIVFDQQNNHILLSQVSECKVAHQHGLSMSSKISEVFVNVLDQTLLENSYIYRHFCLLDILKSRGQQIRKLRVGGCQWKSAYVLWSRYAKCIQTQRNWNPLQSQNFRLKIKKQQDLFIIVKAVNHHSLFVLSILRDQLVLLFHIEFQIRCASVLQAKSLNFLVGFIANEHLHLKIIFRTVEIIEWNYFTPNLNIVILEKYVFAFQTLFFELESCLRRTYQLIEF